MGNERDARASVDQKGHLFLENKINNRGQASEFMSYFNLGK